MKRAVVWNKDFDSGTWRINGEILVLEETRESIRVRRWWQPFSSWYPIKSMGIRFEIIEPLSH